MTARIISSALPRFNSFSGWLPICCPTIYGRTMPCQPSAASVASVPPFLRSSTLRSLRLLRYARRRALSRYASMRLRCAISAWLSVRARSPPSPAPAGVSNGSARCAQASCRALVRSDPARKHSKQSVFPLPCSHRASLRPISVLLHHLEQPPCRNLRTTAPVLEHLVLVWALSKAQCHQRAIGSGGSCRCEIELQSGGTSRAGFGSCHGRSLRGECDKVGESDPASRRTG